MMERMVLIFLVIATFHQEVFSFSTLNDCGSSKNVRLRGGKSPLAGRVEVCRNGEWQTVCAQRFNSTDATIVCRELGFSDKGARPINTGFSTGSSRQNIWTEDAVCRGIEESILDCPTRPLGSLQLQLCGHTNNVGVTCKRPSDGELRILGGPSTNAGRLEVYRWSRWGTVCQNYWSAMDARVACRQLGFSAAGAKAVRFGYRMRSQDDPTPILLDYIQCTGSEKRLTDCVKSEQSNCDHTRDAGLVCREATFAELMMQGLMEAMLQGEVESEEQEMQRETAVIEGKANEEKVDIQTLGIGNEAALQNILAELQALLNED